MNLEIIIHATHWVFTLVTYITAGVNCLLLHAFVHLAFFILVVIQTTKAKLTCLLNKKSKIWKTVNNYLWHIAFIVNNIPLEEFFLRGDWNRNLQESWAWTIKHQDICPKAFFVWHLDKRLQQFESALGLRQIQSVDHFNLLDNFIKNLEAYRQNPHTIIAFLDVRFDLDEINQYGLLLKNSELTIIHTPLVPVLCHWR